MPEVDISNKKKTFNLKFDYVYFVVKKLYGEIARLLFWRLKIDDCKTDHSTTYTNAKSEDTAEYDFLVTKIPIIPTCD